MRYNQYLYQLSVQAVPITNIAYWQPVLFPIRLSVHLHYGINLSQLHLHLIFLFMVIAVINAVYNHCNNTKLNSTKHKYILQKVTWLHG